MPERLLGPLMVDVAGLTLTDEERQFLRQPAVGGVILFARNYHSKPQIGQLVDQIRTLRTPPLLVAVDQEGGRVQRFKEGYHPLPALHQFGLMYQEHPQEARKMARLAGKLMAAELIEVGLDFSFAPVLDRYSAADHVIGDRAFHEDVTIIVALAAEYIAGMNSMGMQATGKHFPGHGVVQGDSHLMKPVDMRTWDELQHSDLIPFGQLADRLGGIMTAHVHYPVIDPQTVTFSSFWIHQVLRHKMGFDGVVFSDDLSMGGALDAGDPVDRVERALEAGCDMALLCNDPSSARWVSRRMGGQNTNQARLLRMRPRAVRRPAQEEIRAMRQTLARLP